MKNFVAIISMLLVFNAFSQHNWVQIDSFVSEGEVINRNFEEPNLGYRMMIEYENGKPYNVERYGGGWEIDTQFTYYPNGEMAAYFYYEKAHYCSDFKLFDTSGVKYYEGAFYNYIRIGTWNAFDKQGNVVASVKYKNNYGDPEIEVEDIRKEIFQREKGTEIQDTLLLGSETGRDFTYSYTLRGMARTWGEAIEINLPKKMPVDNPNLYYHDGIIGWFPLSPYAIINEFVPKLPGQWDMSMYLDEPINEKLQIPEVLLDVHNEWISNKKYMAGFYMALYNKDDIGKVVDFYATAEGYTAYEPGMQIKKGGYFYFLETRSYAVLLDIDEGVGKFRKVLTEFVPQFIDILIENKEMW